MTLVQKALWYIESRFHDDFSLKDVACASGVSQHYLIRAFRKIIGTSVMKYVKARRLHDTADSYGVIHTRHTRGTNPVGVFYLSKINHLVIFSAEDDECVKALRAYTFGDKKKSFFAGFVGFQFLTRLQSLNDALPFIVVGLGWGLLCATGNYSRQLNLV